MHPHPNSSCNLMFPVNKMDCIMELINKIEEIDNFFKQQRNEFITVNGTRIRYIVVGSGTPILLVHGIGGFLETWGFNLIPLSKFFKVYVIDLPGHGLSQMVENCYTFTCGMDVIIKIVDALGLKQTSLIGHSLGGIICIGATLRLTNRISKLILVNAAGLSRYVPWYYRLASLPGLGNILTTLVSRKKSKSFTQRLFYNQNLLPKELVDWISRNRQVSWTIQDLFKLLRVNVSLGGFRTEIDVINKLHLINTPTLLIHGAQDNIIPLKHAEKASNMLPNSEVIVFQGCGHLAHVEKAKEFNESVIAFLKR